MFFAPNSDVRNAKVIRLDDVGQVSTSISTSFTHGFHLVGIDTGPRGVSAKVHAQHQRIDCPDFGNPVGNWVERCPRNNRQPGMVEKDRGPVVEQEEFSAE
jgi:hypothetical protein